MADRSGYIGRAPGDSSVIIARKSYEPTGVQTDFTFNSGYTPGYCDVYLNGVRLIDEKDYTASNGSTVGLTSAAQSGDVVELVVYKAYNLGVPLADVTGNLDVTGNISASSSITGATLFGDGSNLSGIPGVAVTQYIDANSLTVIGSPGVSTITRLGVTDAVVTGIITANGLSGNVTGAAITVTGQATFSSNVSIGGTLTYEDVTNVDSVGLITARSGIAVTGGQLTVGAAFSVGHAGVCTATTFVGSLTGNVAGNASSASEATTVTVTANESGDELLYLAMVDGTSSGQAIEADSSLQYNPSKGEIKVGVAFSVGAAGIVTAAGFDGGTVAGSTGSFTGDVDIADKIVHTGDTNTALRFPAADTITAETGGSERVRITSTGFVGVNETSPSCQLHVEQDVAHASTFWLNSDAGIMIDNKNSTANTPKRVLKLEGDAAIVYGSTSTGDLLFNQRETNVLTLAENRSVGIGTTNPTFAAINSISANAARGIELFKHGTDTGSAIKLAGRPGDLGQKHYSQLGFSGANGTAHWANYNTSGTEVGKIVIGSTGNIGIGTQSPQRALHISTNNTVVALTDTAASSDEKTKYILSDAGDLGIGKLNDAYDTAVEHLRIDNNGRLLIGSQRTYSDQSYYDDITINNSDGSGASGGTGITLISDSGSWGAFLFGDEDDNDVGSIKYDHSNNIMRFTTGTTDTFQINATTATFAGSVSDSKGDVRKII